MDEITFSQCEECGQLYPDCYGFDYCPYCGIKFAEVSNGRT